MEFKINAGNFRYHVANATSVCNGKQIIPIYNNILLEHDGQNLCVSATNLAQGIRSVVADIPGTAGKVTVPAKKLLALLGSLPAEQMLMVSTEDTKGFVDIKTETGHFSLLGLPAVDFVDFVPETENEDCLTLNTADLSEIFTACSAAISKDDSRVALTGLLFEYKNNAVTCVATDGKRMAISCVSATCSKEFSIIIPQSAIPLINKISGNEVKIFVADQKIVCFGETETVVSKLISGNYPNWRMVIPSEYKLSVPIDAETLANSVKLVSSVIETERAISLGGNGNSIKLNACSEAVGMGFDEIIVDTNITDAFEINLNPRYLLDALNGARGHVFIKLNDPLAPICIERNENSFTILMPIRAK